MVLGKDFGLKIVSLQCYSTGNEVDKRLVFGALLTDLLKAFDCLSHELINAKLIAYGFSLSSLKLIDNYLSKRH